MIFDEQINNDGSCERQKKIKRKPRFRRTNTSGSIEVQHKKRSQWPRNSFNKRLIGEHDW